MKETLTGNLGYTFDNQPVSQDIGVAIWPTILLIGTSTIASIVLGVWIGIAQGWRWGTKFDQSWLGVTLVLYSMPEFWFGLLMIMLFSVTFNIFPSGGMQTARSRLPRGPELRRYPESPGAAVLRPDRVATWRSTR